MEESSLKISTKLHNESIVTCFGLGKVFKLDCDEAVRTPDMKYIAKLEFFFPKTYHTEITREVENLQDNFLC